MNRYSILTALFVTVFIMSNTSYGHDNESTLTGPYVGQEPPGLIPKAFAPRGYSTEYRDGSGFFSLDMKEFYFTRRNHNDGKWSLVVFKLEDNQWRESVVGPRVGRPIFSPDGKTMHLGKHYMERTGTGWSELKSLGPMFEDIRIMRLVSSTTGTYYFDEASESGPMRYSRLIDGKREKPQELSIEMGKWNAHPYVAPDESYIMWDGEIDNGFGDNDLYISFKQQNGSWGKAINLGDEINTPAEEGGAYVTPDGKYLFFNRTRGAENQGMYWVDAQIIEIIRSESQTNDKRSLASNKE